MEAVAALDQSGWFRSPLLFAEAKGVAGLGKAGGDGQGGSDKAGQQVPPEVYMALTYAGTLFLFTLSVPLILYGLNKLLNKIEDCFGCGSSSKERKAKQLAKESSTASIQQQSLVNGGHNSATRPDHFLPSNATRQSQHNQRLNLQLLQQHPKYSQFISMSSKPDFGAPYDSSSLDKAFEQPQQPPPPPLQQHPPPGANATRQQQQPPHPSQNNQDVSPRTTAVA